ncbi:DUF1501 domain-containing protein [Limnoglobus roseus]|uniref:DUF1501 domain-containing protein n=1 Tax=Limnoglobus roseus TaxID=2598579 RepID=A0A5C1A857_9BACT|nr:DUF1501 domain-containing protein [Limnoglobus roseus]QEL14363.1 hypothetical protein PX52LOC_01251 [Limnoglobus roseus]
MLSFRDPTARREFLRVGGLALGGLSLASTLAPAGSPLATAGRPLTDKSVIFLFLHGGPSQIETFDPKMTAPDGVRSATGEIKTAIPGVTFGGTFPKLAALADRFSVVRSFVTGDGNHDIKPIVGKDSFGANLGSAYASAAGSNHPVSGMPRNIALFPQAVEAMSQPAQAGFGNFLSTGPFGPASAPFAAGGGGPFQKDLTLNVSQEKLGDRRSLLTVLDHAKLAFDENAVGMDATREKAFSILLGGVGDAFDLTKEDPKTLARYDTAGLLDVEKINKKLNNRKFYTDNARTLGKLLLMARRLCERGAGFVTVTTNFVWDMHADVNNAPMTEGMSYTAPPLDHAVSAFLEDTRQRGLSDKILLVACGEMGRTPTINKNGGRDHWGGLAPLLLAGGGLKMGQVVGRSDAKAGSPNSDPVLKRNLISTVMNTLFDTGKLRVTRGVARELLAMIDADPIAGF